MKYFYLVIFCFFFINSNHSQNNGTIIYRIVSEELKPLENDSQVKQKFMKMMNSMSRLRDSLFFNLDFNNNESLFYLDKNKNIGISNEKGYNAILRSFGSSKYYRNNKLLIEEINSDRLYLISSSTNIFQWKITKETKKINNYLCFKAITHVKTKSIVKGNYTKVVEAWYCPEIAINLGPKNYGGLPGLIFELKEGKLIYYLYSININPKEDIIINKPNKGKVATREEYNEMLPHITKDNFNQYIGG
jgi:GLPGLI family protein